MQAESKSGSFAVIRYNLRTYESGGVMAVIKGGRKAPRPSSSSSNKARLPEDRHIGWRYFLEKTDLKAGMGSRRGHSTPPISPRNSRSRSLRVTFPPG